MDLVVSELKDGDSANLVLKYLELSSLMSPALPLPGMVRFLEEPNLLPLQRIAMEQQLRQDLGIPKGEAVSDWRSRVADHLQQEKTVLPE